MDLALDLSVFMTSPDPGFNNIARQIFGKLDDSSFYACLRVCKSWHRYLDPEWQVRRRKAMFEQVKPDFISLMMHTYGKKEKKEFIEKLLDPNILLELSENDYNNAGWCLFASAFRANNMKMLRFLLNHPNIKTITFGRKNSFNYVGCWATNLLAYSGWTEDTLKMILAHHKCQPFGYDMELGKTRIPFAFNCMFWFIPFARNRTNVAKMILRYPKLGPVDFSTKHHNSQVGNALHCAISNGNDNVPMIELILDHCPQNILTETGKGSDRYSPLHLAIGENRPDIVKILLNHRKFESHFLVSLKMKHMVTPIQMAVGRKRLEIVKVILDHHKCDRSMLLSLDGSLKSGFLSDEDQEVKKFVIEHPKMKSIKNFVEEYLK